jgi:dynein heavy chain 1
MFRVFARFNPPLARFRVRVFVKEFQLQLINTVGQAVQKLQSKFMHKYESSSASTIATLRGIPPVSGKILWAKQMERQVHALMKRMGDVLGKEWGQQLEGRQLRRSCALMNEIYAAAASIETFDSTFVHCGYRWV